MLSNFTIGLLLFVLVLGLMIVGKLQVNVGVNPHKVIHLTGQINTKSVAPLIYTLQNAKASETIHVYVTSPGGDAFAMIDVVYHLKQTKAKVIYHITSLAASAAAVISCYADEVIAEDNAVIMFHLIQTPLGVLLTARSPVDHILIKSQNEIFKQCEKLLNKQQVKSLYAGKDVYLSGKELIANSRGTN